MPRETLERLDPEQVAAWFFRLNGCLLIQNFVVHPDPPVDLSRNQQRTDADVLGVRFPYRHELGMHDMPQFSAPPGKTLVFLAEVKRGGRCRLNGPWTRPSERNLHRVLGALGAFDHSEVDRAAEELSCHEIYENDHILFRMIAMARAENPLYARAKPNVLQITWQAALTFVHQRFSEHRIQKLDHNQWSALGRALWNLSLTAEPSEFVQRVTERFAE